MIIYFNFYFYKNYYRDIKNLAANPLLKILCTVAREK